MPKANTLVRTKLRLPFIRPDVVVRPRLQARIAQGLRGPLTLITAPAGFGKTTLVASSVAGCDMPVAWLSLDKNDNQVERFLGYLVAALQEADPALGSEAQQLLAAARQAAPEAIVTSLINDLDTAGRQMALVLDDYHLVNSQSVHGEVAFLLEHCPRTFHLVIATRSDPPLPLARLRARGQAVELRAADLGFTEAEAARFLSEVMGLRLDAGSVAVLAERTEGWIAGLQMAALSIRDREDVPGFIAGFSGTNRYILDYLLEEVLAGQPPEVQRFLLHTSILERLSAPLCDAVRGASGSWESGEVGIGEPGRVPDFAIPAAPPPASQPILEYLERVNLFLVPVDDERSWYRYHHLFAGLLRAQLLRSAGAEAVAQLHVRAADWHAESGSILEAIDHASAAADDKRVERLIEQHYLELVSRGEMSGMRLWRGQLSKELVYRRPWLCIYEAYSHAWFGELDEADVLLAEAERHIARIRSGVSAPDAGSMQAHLAYVQSRVTAMHGDLPRAIELCRQARALVPAGNPALQFDTHVTLGYEYFLAGDLARAGQILNEAIREGTSAGAVIHTVAASCMMARLYAEQGLLQKSYDTYRAAAGLIPEASAEHRDATALVEAGIADVLCEWNDLDAALSHVQQGLALLPLWAKVDDLVLATVTLARIHLARGNRDGAAQAVGKALEAVRTSGVFSEARQAAEVAQVRLWLAQGDLQAAGRWAASQAEGSGDLSRFENERAHIARARVLVARHEPGRALGLLAHLQKTARAAGRMGRAIEISLLQALALREVGDSDGALLALAGCLALAEPEGYQRILLDEGRPVQMLLAQWLAHAGAGPLQDYALGLLSRFDAEPHLATAGQGEASPAAAAGLAEPLSQRELEVLHLLALGRTNREIAAQLIVAPGTVKAHTASIYRKLDVGNRTEAVARARQLGILP